MSFSGNNGVGQTVQTLDPRIYQQWADANEFAKTISDQGYEPYLGATHAGDNSFYQDARSTIQQAQGAGQGLIGQATDAFNDVAGGSPMFINAPTVGQTTQAQAAQMGDVLDVMPERAIAGAIPGTNLSAYMNPYQSSVIDQSNAEIERQRILAQTQNAYAASQAGAFGGSRHGLIDAENNRNFAQQKQQNTNGLLQSGYDRATGLMTSDLDRVAQTSQFNTGQANQAWTGNADRDLAAREADAARRQQAGMAFADADNGRNQFNAQQALSALQGNQAAESETSRLNLEGARGLLDTGQQQQNMMLTQAGALTGAADKLRESQQAQYDQEYAQFQRRQGEGDADLARRLQPFGILPSTSSGGVTSSNSRSKGYST